MKQHLRIIKKAIADHDEAFKDYSAKTATLHAMLENGFSGLRGKAASSAALSGHLGNLIKLANAHASAAKMAKMANTAAIDGMSKSCDAMAKISGVDLLVRNSNDRSDEGATVYQGGDTTGPGEISHGKGMTAGELQKASDTLAAPTVFSKVQRQVGNVNKNARVDPFGFAKSTPVSDSHLRR